MIDLPTITASQAAELASRFARQLVGKPDDIYQQQPAANLGPEFQDMVVQAHAGTLP